MLSQLLLVVAAGQCNYHGKGNWVEEVLGPVVLLLLLLLLVVVMVVVLVMRMTGGSLGSSSSSWLIPRLVRAAVAIWLT